MTNDEITRLVSSCECTQLEVELAARLAECMAEVREVVASISALPVLTEQLSLADYE